MKQLRNRADEDARLVHMSLQMDSELPSSLRKDLDHLMILVSVFSKHMHILISANIPFYNLSLTDYVIQNKDTHCRSRFSFNS